MKPTHTHIARVCHEANRALRATLGEDPGPHWETADAHTRDSALHGVTSALEGATPAQSHQAWADHKRAHGWKWGPTKDTAARTHPCLVPYDQLPPAQRTKDTLFLAVVHALT